MARQFLQKLRAHGALGVREVRLKDNRRTLVSRGRDGVLHVHACFLEAPEPVVRALAALAGGAPPAEVARARETIREWVGGPGREAFLRERRNPPAGGRRRRYGEATACVGTPAQRRRILELYRRLNEEDFGGSLPAEPRLRLSGRMSRRYGHCALGRTEAGEREVVEIALNRDLLLEGNEELLLETLAHEMAHAEAWLAHGERGHGRRWKAVARRLGIRARACTEVRIRRG